MTTKALALFSGGLDSILACRVMALQGIEVLAVKFVSPFFDRHLLGSDYCQKIDEKYEINVQLVDISDDYIQLLRSPAHGFGKHFNPCLDCKIFMMSRAREMMQAAGASFLISGEVVGQRPMSQRRDALRLVERDSGCDGILLRPLCAKKLEPTNAELAGLVDREELYDINGRSRSGQIALAKEFGVTDYPTPAGGCMLTDPVVGQRIKLFYAEHENISASDIQHITVGRQFQLPGGGWLALGHKESENILMEGNVQPQDVQLRLEDRPGPLAVLRFETSKDDIEIAASLVARYGKKDSNGNPCPGRVRCIGDGDDYLIDASPIAEDRIAPMRR
nr:thiamine biosynthesis protein [Desulfobulbaceae bacterium]